MSAEYAVFLRNNRTPSMEPLRAALVGLGLTDVESFGSSGNFVFRTSSVDCGRLERDISEALGAQAIIRDRHELSEVVAANPYAGRPGSEVFLLARAVDSASVAFSNSFDPDGDPPIVHGANVYFVNPTRFAGRKGIIDFERELGVRGTRRTSRVVERVLGMM